MVRPTLPKRVAQRIAEAAARGETVVVVPQGKVPSRVFRLSKYLHMRELPKKVKPWNARRRKEASPDPLKAVKGRVVSPLRREDIYG